MILGSRKDHLGIGLMSSRWFVFLAHHPYSHKLSRSRSRFYQSLVGTISIFLRISHLKFECNMNGWNELGTRF